MAQTASNAIEIESPQSTEPKTATNESTPGSTSLGKLNDVNSKVAVGKWT